MKSNKSNKLSIVLTVSILSVVLIILCLISFFSNRVAKNPADTVGNTPGNLYNSGLFVQNGDQVFFANSYDAGSLYRMSAGEEKITKISNSVVCNLLADDHYLYYFQKGTAGEGGFANVASGTGYNRSNHKGDKTTTITKDTIIAAQLVGNRLYLQSYKKNSVEFYRINTDRKEKTLLASRPVNPACVANGNIYYSNDSDGHYLYSLDTATDISRLYLSKNLWNPIIYGDYIYYMDVDRNYCLCRYSIAEENEEILTKERVDTYNVGSGYIYYQKNGAVPQLRFMRTDGTEETVLAEGNFCNINMTSQYVYFQEFGEKTDTYHTTIGSPGYSLFAAAKEAVKAK